MAIPVNARDNMLQTTTPRVEVASLPSNLSVDASQVPGLVAMYDSTREVRLSASSQIFQIPKVGPTLPASITLTAILKNITGTPTFTTLSGTVEYSVNGNVATFLASGLTTNTATIRVSVLYNSVTYTDTMTIVKVTEGQDGIVGLLSNESVTVAATAAGTVAAGTLNSSGGTFHVFDGITNKTGDASVTYSVFSESFIDVSIAATGVYTINSLSAESASATLRAVYTKGGNSITIDKVFTVAKAVAGSNGGDAKLLYLSATSQVFQVSKAGVNSPASITLTSSGQNLTGTPAFSTNPAVTLTGSGNSRVLTYANMTSDSVTVTVTHDGLTDTVTLVKVREGIDGVTPVVGFLTNESTQVPAASDGVVQVSALTTVGGTFKLFDGVTDKTTSGAVTYSVFSETGVDVSINSSGVYTVASISADIGNATLRAVYNPGSGNVTIDKVYTITKSKVGVKGDTGVRGTANVARAITGSVWLDSEAALALSSNGYGAPLTRDIVTLYNTTSAFSQSKFWSGTVWTTLDAYVNGNMLVTGSVTADKLNIGGSPNMMPNAAFVEKMPDTTPYGWTSLVQNSAPNPYTWGINLAGTSWTPVSVNSLHLQQVGNSNVGQYSVLVPNISVVAGQWYELSVYTGAHRCKVELSGFWYNITGNNLNPSGITEVMSDMASNVLTNDEEGMGGQNLATGYKRLYAIVRAPAGAVTFRPFFRKHGTKATFNDSWMMLTRPFFGAARSQYQTELSAWTPSGMSTQIHGGSIVTDTVKASSLAAVSANLGSITSGDIQGAVIHGGGYTHSTFNFPSQVGLAARTGFHLSGNGLLFGDDAVGKYVSISANGDIYTPQFSSVNGLATFDGTLTAGRVVTDTIVSSSISVATTYGTIPANALSLPIEHPNTGIVLHYGAYLGTPGYSTENEGGTVWNAPVYHYLYVYAAGGSSPVHTISAAGWKTTGTVNLPPGTWYLVTPPGTSAPDAFSIRFKR